MSPAPPATSIARHCGAVWAVGALCALPVPARAHLAQTGLGPFYDGAFRIAIQTKAPLAVETITNMSKIASGYNLSPGTVRIVWDEPIPTDGMTADDIPALKDRVEKMMRERLGKD